MQTQQDLVAGMVAQIQARPKCKPEVRAQAVELVEFVCTELRGKIGFVLEVNEAKKQKPINLMLHGRRLAQIYAKNGAGAKIDIERGEGHLDVVDLGLPHGAEPLKLRISEALTRAAGPTAAPKPNAVSSALDALKDLGTAETDLDGQALATVRREQKRLRDALVAGRTTAECSVCGDAYPVSLLNAAHIKPRSECSMPEKLDIRNVTLMCVLGCDALFEQGFVVVTSGVVSAGRRHGSSAATAAVDRLVGKLCTAHSAESDGYFTARNARTANKN